LPVLEPNVKPPLVRLPAASKPKVLEPAPINSPALSYW
jgi:hypothetical protein